MENQSVLRLTWEGDLDGQENWVMGVYVNGQEAVSTSYTDAWTVDIPLSDENLELKITVTRDNGRTITHFKRIFKINPHSNYTCVVDGSVKKASGLGVRFCEGDEMDENVSKVSGNKGMIVFLSVMFPAYGIYKAITDAYMRASALIGACAGFMLGMIISFMANEEGDMIGFGIGHKPWFEYEPFSFLDIVINLLIGGAASIRGLVAMMFESIFS